MKSTIAVLMACHNRKEKTILCLDNLFKQEGINDEFKIEVFLMDDASTDGTSNAVGELFSQVNIINGNGQLYWNKGMHLAWTTAITKNNYDYYLWLNDDTNLLPNAVLEMLNSESKFQNRALVCGAVCSYKTKQFTYGGRLRNGKGIIPNGIIQECFLINGNCVLVSKKIVDSVGILDPIFPHAIGDVEYGLRAFYAGFKLIVPGSYVGFCENNEFLPKWCYGSTPILERFRTLYSPLGNCHPYYYFIFERRHYGFLTAAKHYCSIHLRALIPSLWNAKIRKERGFYS